VRLWPEVTRHPTQNPNACVPSSIVIHIHILDSKKEPHRNVLIAEACWVEVSHVVRRACVLSAVPALATAAFADMISPFLTRCF
jgi:hypothetical protein